MAHDYIQQQRAYPPRSYGQLSAPQKLVSIHDGAGSKQLGEKLAAAVAAKEAAERASAELEGQLSSAKAERQAWEERHGTGDPSCKLPTLLAFTG